MQGPVEELFLEPRSILTPLVPAGEVLAQFDHIGQLSFEILGAVLNSGQEIFPGQGGAQTPAPADQDTDPEQEGSDQNRQAQSQVQFENGIKNK